MGSEAGRPSTVRARELGTALTRRRRTAELARMLGWSPSKVSRLEAGTRGTNVADVASYYHACGKAERDEYARLVTLAQETDTGYWLRTGDEPLPAQLRSLILQESTACSITSYEPCLVPGLLQTEQYIRELFRWGGTGSTNVDEQWLRVRLQRQGVLSQRPAPRTTFFVQEHALRTTVGSAQVMHEQLLHLVFSTMRCGIRVILDAAGPFSAAGYGFMLFGYVDHQPVVYTNTWTTGLFIERPQDVVRYRRFLADVDEAALPEGESREWLADLASAYDRMETGTDDAHRAAPADLA